MCRSQQYNTLMSLLAQSFLLNIVDTPQSPPPPPPAAASVCFIHQKVQRCQRLNARQAKLQPALCAERIFAGEAALKARGTNRLKVCSVNQHRF